MNNQKRCFFCHSGAMKFQPITNKKGEIISLHNICQSCNKNQTKHSLAKKKKTSLLNSKRTFKTSKPKSRLLKGMLVTLVSAALSYNACIGLASAAFMSNTVSFQQTPVSSSTAPQSAQEALRRKESIEMVSTTTVKEYVLEQAKIAGVHVAKVDHMAEHESHYNTKAVGDMNITCERTGKPVRARGIFQITECFHPEVSDEQAFDYKWATAWALNIIAHSKKDCISQWATCASWYSKT